MGANCEEMRVKTKLRLHWGCYDKSYLMRLNLSKINQHVVDQNDIVSLNNLLGKFIHCSLFDILLDMRWVKPRNFSFRNVFTPCHIMKLDLWRRKFSHFDLVKISTKLQFLLRYFEWLVVHNQLTWHPYSFVR